MSSVAVTVRMEWLQRSVSILSFIVIPLLIFVTQVSTAKKEPPPVVDEYAGVRSKGPEARSKKLLKHPEMLWSGAAVIYKIDFTIGCPWSTKCWSIILAMREYSKKTCVRFKERSGERDYVRFSEDRLMRGAEATVGRGIGETSIICNSKSWSRSMVLHELGHTLSLIDEHKRPDRDQYLNVYPNNALKEFRWVFEKMDQKDVNLLGEPLDRKSIMMYERHTFGKYPFSILPTLKLRSGHWLRHRKHLSAGDVRRIQDLYRCDGAKQKPSWPVDVFCSFDEEECGFKWWRGISTWKLVPKTEGEGGYLESALRNIRGSPTRENPNIWSVNFHGLSSFDPERGPEGCISFKYLLETKISKQVSLKLLKVDLKTPLDFFPKSKDYFEIWSTNDLEQSLYPGKWSQVSIRTKVTGPFMLEFRSSFVDKNNKGSAKIDDLEVKYTPCEHPTHVDNQMFSGKLSKQSTLSWLRSMRKRLPCSS